MIGDLETLLCRYQEGLSALSVPSEKERLDLYIGLFGNQCDLLRQLRYQGCVVVRPIWCFEGLLVLSSRDLVKGMELV